jgi:hypothetical protein
MGGPATPALVSPYAIHLKQFTFLGMIVRKYSSTLTRLIIV